MVCFLKEMLYLLISVLPSVVDTNVNHFFNHEFVYRSRTGFCLCSSSSSSSFLLELLCVSLDKDSFLIILHVHYSANFPTCCSHFRILWMLLWKIWLVARELVNVRYLSHLVIHVLVVPAYNFLKKYLPFCF